MIKTIHLYMFFASIGFFASFQSSVLMFSSWFSCDVSVTRDFSSIGSTICRTSSNDPSGVNDIGCVSVETPSRWIYNDIHSHIYNHIYIYTQLTSRLFFFWAPWLVAARWDNRNSPAKPLGQALFRLFLHSTFTLYVTVLHKWCEMYWLTMPRSTSVNHCIPTHEDLTTGNHCTKTSARLTAIFPVNGKDDTGIALHLVGALVTLWFAVSFPACLKQFGYLIK